MIWMATAPMLRFGAAISRWPRGDYISIHHPRRRFDTWWSSGIANVKGSEAVS